MRSLSVLVRWTCGQCPEHLRLTRCMSGSGPAAIQVHRTSTDANWTYKKRTLTLYGKVWLRLKVVRFSRASFLKNSWRQWSKVTCPALAVQVCLSHGRMYFLYMSRLMSKEYGMCAQRRQISLGICQVWSVFDVRMKKRWDLGYSVSAQRRLWSDWADAQPDLSLRWAQMLFSWFCHEAAQLCKSSSGPNNGKVVSTLSKTSNYTDFELR